MRLVLLLCALVGCGPDPELVAERDQLQAEATELRTKLERAERERDTLSARVKRLQEESDARDAAQLLEKLGVAPGGKLGASLETSLGTFTCELYPEKSPKTVLNFVELAEGSREWTDPVTGQKVRRPLYDGTIFHRVIPGFMIQGGDPLGNGRGGPGYKFEDETSNGLGFDRPGLLAMANSGPNTNGSQFFITEGTPTHLDGKHTIFGACEPLDLVQRITNVPRNRSDRPEADVVLRKVRITR